MEKEHTLTKSEALRVKGEDLSDKELNAYALRFMKLSAVIITKNAEEVIEDCLKSITFCDEIIVVDGGSTDKTNEIAKRYHAKIVKGNSESFAEQRNIGLHSAKGEWVLYIDADERVTSALREEIKSVVASSFPPHPIRSESHGRRLNPLPLSSHSALSSWSKDKRARFTPLLKERKNEVFTAFKLKRKNFYFGNHEWPSHERLERLFKKDTLQGWRGDLHESPIVSGEVGELHGFLLHYTHRDLTSMLQKTIQWSDVEANLRLHSNHTPMTWCRFPRVMMTAFFDSYIKQKGYKAGTVGIIESLYQAFSMFVTYAKLWEKQINIKNQNAKIKITK